MALASLEPEGQGFRISRSALTLRAQVPNLDEAAFARLAGSDSSLAVSLHGRTVCEARIAPSR
jgi:hypothetical protein